MLDNKQINSTTPLVSVVIPVYNVEQYIEQALSSVVAQSYANLEIIIVDDQSPDGSIALVEENFSDPRIHIVRQKNRGLAGARNTGIRYANGKFIALLDSDDFWQPNKIEEHVKVMQQNSCCGVSFSSSLFVDEQSRSLGRYQIPARKKDYQAKHIFCRNPIGNGSAPVIRKTVLEKIAFKNNKTHNGEAYQQYFDEQLTQSEDVDCWTRIALITNTEFHFIDQPLTYYRLNSDGLSADVDKQFKTWAALLTKLQRDAPEFAEKYGMVAKTFQYRYLARRCLLQGQAKLALQLMIRAFKAKPWVLTQELGKTLETTIASGVMALLPRTMQLRLLERIV